MALRQSQTMKHVGKSERNLGVIS